MARDRRGSHRGPVRGGAWRASDSDGRARRRDRDDIGTLEARRDRRGTSGPIVGRGRCRQKPGGAKAARIPRSRAPYRPSFSMFAVPRQLRAASDHRALRTGRRIRCQGFGGGKARQTQRGPRTIVRGRELYDPAVRQPIVVGCRRRPGAARAEPSTAQGNHPRSLERAGARLERAAAGVDGLRGRALDRPDEPGVAQPVGGGPSVGPRDAAVDLPAGLSGAVDRSPPRPADDADSVGPGAGRVDGREGRRRHGFDASLARPDPVADRWCSALYRRADQMRPGKWIGGTRLDLQGR